MGLSTKWRIAIWPTLVDVVAALPHLREGGWLDAIFLFRSAGYRVEAHVGDDCPVEHPHVGPIVRALDSWRRFLKSGRQAPFEQIGRLHRVVVDADENEIFGLYNTVVPCYILKIISEALLGAGLGGGVSGKQPQPSCE